MEGINLNSIVTKTATQWVERAKEDRANREEIRRFQRITLELLEELDNIEGGTGV